jgi:two-component system cell cycle response regulator
VPSASGESQQPIPPQDAPLVAAGSAGTDAPDPARPTVLVIDDSQDVHRLLRARLRSEELDIISVPGGQEGLAAARERCPAIILLDLDMPVMDGFEVLRTLKDDSATNQIPVIVLSGLQSSQDKVTAFDLGAVDYITKPFDLTELRVRVRSALRLQQLVQMLAQRAQIDGLTGLWNRAFFDRRWGEEVSRALRHSRPLSVAMLDLDHFKSVNDTYGHPAGDAVIVALARVLQRESRASDIACRYGGEEFVLIMPDTGPADAATVCERIGQALEAISWARHPERKITASIGLAGMSGSTILSSQAWIETVDKNLYTAKRAGRNRVVTTDVTSTPALRAAG